MNENEKIAKIKKLIEKTEFDLIENAAQCLIDIILIVYK